MNEHVTESSHAQWELCRILKIVLDGGIECHQHWKSSRLEPTEHNAS